eukprot:IDg2867t1
MARDESRPTWDVRTSAFGRFWRTDAPPSPERVPSELLRRRFASTRLPGISLVLTQRLRAEPRKAVLNPKRCFPLSPLLALGLPAGAVGPRRLRLARPSLRNRGRYPVFLPEQRPEDGTAWSYKPVQQQSQPPGYPVRLASPLPL